MPANISHRIKTRRKELGLSQDALARACGVGQSTVANWERGGHTPRQATLDKIAIALQSDEVWLLSGEHANTRGLLNNYLTRPIHHVAIFDWPSNAPELSNALPQSYIAVTTEHKNLFGLIINVPIRNFKKGTVLTFTRNYNAAETGIFLDMSQDACSLSDACSPHTEARLIYSLTPH